jgi:peptide/nickel transport system permease protein
MAPWARAAALRLLRALLTLLAVFTITFAISRIIPGDPAALWVGPRPRPEEVERAREFLHLDRPLPEQYLLYLAGLFRGDLGLSIRTHNPVLQDISFVLPATLELVIAAFSLSSLAGALVGVVAASRRGRPSDGAIRVLSTASASLPAFFLGIALQLLVANLGLPVPIAGRLSSEVSVLYPIRPITGLYTLDALLEGNLTAYWDALGHLLLPALALSAYPFGLAARMVRTMMVEVLEELHSKALLAWGLPRRRLLYKYALRNALSPALASLALSFAYTLTGAFLVEVIFAWPGLGSYMALSILSLDYPAILGSTVVVASFYIAANSVVDVLQAYLDPRLRASA